MLNNLRGKKKKISIKPDILRGKNNIKPKSS